MGEINKPCVDCLVMVRLLICFLLIVVSCNQGDQHLQWEEYSKYLQDEKSGIVKKKKVDDIELTVQYLPPDYIAYKELNNLKDEVTFDSFDSLRSGYSNSETYVLTINYVSTPLVDLLWSGITDQEMYQERVYLLSFRMAEYIKLKRGGKTYSPALAHYDAVQGLNSRIKIMAVFPIDTALDGSIEAIEQNDDQYRDILFDDPFWNTGLHYFVFNNKDITQIPALRID